jgi:hypothetical protein
VLAPMGLALRSVSVQASVIRRPVGDMGLIGTLFTSSGSRERLAVIVLTGAGGGIDEPVARSLAEAGFSAVALGTHNVEGCRRFCGRYRSNIAGVR